ncbi:MAG: hypothetical protein HYV02_08730 [Deltaproteobacteria bacterium]|nr:hypothetical protein [Deltaproteobacteria bacterium]
MQRPTACSVEGCKRPHRAKGWCDRHFRKWRRGEMPTSRRYKICGKEECRKPRYRWGVCETHYLAMLGKTPPAPQGAPTGAGNAATATPPEGA